LKENFYPWDPQRMFFLDKMTSLHAPLHGHPSFLFKAEHTALSCFPPRLHLSGIPPLLVRLYLPHPVGPFCPLRHTGALSLKSQGFTASTELDYLSPFRPSLSLSPPFCMFLLSFPSSSNLVKYKAGCSGILPVGLVVSPLPRPEATGGVSLFP